MYKDLDDVSVSKGLITVLSLFYGSAVSSGQTLHSRGGSRWGGILGVHGHTLGLPN